MYWTFPTTKGSKHKHDMQRVEHNTKVHGNTEHDTKSSNKSRDVRTRHSITSRCEREVGLFVHRQEKRREDGEREVGVLMVQ